jgi:4-hydroxythreonine-4-phosphate dehydrogenase
MILTPGEPGGVGIEITLKAWMALREKPEMAFALLGDAKHVARVSQSIGMAATILEISSLDQVATVFERALPVIHHGLPTAVVAGQFSATTAPWVMERIEEAVELCLVGDASAMITNPIQKEALYAAGFAYQGHTDFLAALTRQRGLAASDVMMLVGGGLRAVPITVHIPLKDVPAALTTVAILTQARVVHAALKNNFGVAAPRLAVTGLNPHAGENGSMGREEIDVIIPAVQQLQTEGLDVKGPLPADTAFFPEMRKTYDAILCMYHDQALIPVKTLDFHGGVNVTLGLPFIRTSPDHGTALDLAGTGKAHCESLIAAIALAQEMSSKAHSA